MFASEDNYSDYMKNGHIVIEGTKLSRLNDVVTQREHFFRYETLGGDREFAATMLTMVVLHEVGDGDGENGGARILKKCIGDIWNMLYHHGSYQYADLEFTLTENN